MNPCDRSTPAFYRYLGVPVDVRDELLTVQSGIPQPLFNGVFGTASGAAPTLAAVRSVSEALQQEAPLHSWWMRDDQTPAGFAEALLELGYHSAGEFPGMLCPASGVTPVEPPAELTIRRITSVEDFSRWAKLLCDVFDIQGEAQTAYQDLLQGHLQDRFVCLAGELDGRVVSTASILLEEQEGYIFNIGTHPDVRKKGYGLALTHAVMQLGLEAGCDTLALMSSPMAESLYKKLGFESRYRYLIYMSSTGAVTDQ